MAKKLNRNSVALAGEFAVLSQLMLQGYNANLTLGHTKGVDILIADPENDKMYKLEVKTNYRSNNSKGINSKLFGRFESTWPMKKRHETMVEPNLYYCFVNINKNDNIFKYYILHSSIVAKYVKAQHKIWLKAKSSHRDTEMRSFRIGFKNESYFIKNTPTVEDFEDKWNFK